MLSEIPRIPTGITKAHLTLEGDRLLGLYTKIPEEQIAMGVPPNPNVLEEGTADAPLVRLYNFMRKLIPFICARALHEGASKVERELIV